MPGLQKGDLWWADLGLPHGHTQAGRRPAIVISEVVDAQSVTVVPMTSNLERLRFPFTFAVHPSPSNGLKERSVALVFQVRHLDRTFLVQRIGKLGGPDLEGLDALLRDLLKLSA